MTVNLSGAIPGDISEKQLHRTVREVFRVARRVSRGSVALRFVSNDEIAALNRRYRKKNRPTDVLAFPAEAPDWGDIIIAPAYAKKEALKRDIPLREELIRLVSHGVLHLLGYDHATEPDERRMFRLQERVVKTCA